MTPATTTTKVQPENFETEPEIGSKLTTNNSSVNTNRLNHVNLRSEADIYKYLIRPQTLERSLLRENKNQVAGHAGFSVMHNNPNNCLKPLIVQCLRGKREHFFYQLLEFFKKNKYNTRINDSDSINKLCYKQFKLLTTPANQCDCVIDSDVWREMSAFVASFQCVICPTNNAQNSESDVNVDDHQIQEGSLDSIYLSDPKCVCYQSGFGKKMSCQRVDSEVHYLCLEDLTAHCAQPCILDVKIGKITYDPMSVKEKILEQSSKYDQSSNCGFHILGMKIGSEMKNKQFCRGLETERKIQSALELFFEPLTEISYKLATLNNIIQRLEYILNWFESRNIDQLKFFSSSLLIVYDSHVNSSTTTEHISDAVRVSMIDFAHVFHHHSNKKVEGQTNEKDDNFLYGLTRLTKLFTTIYHRLQGRHPHQPLPLHPPQV